MSDYRSDPRWQEAHGRYLAEDAPGETDSDVLARRIQAAYDLQAIEREHGRWSQ